MFPIEYQRLRSFESWYWWYLAQRADLLDALASLHLPRRAKLLDAGCGTGKALAEAVTNLGLHGFGVDVSSRAAVHWHEAPELLGCVGSVNQLPYPDQSFDAAMSIDVIGSQGVDAARAMEELARTLRPGGFLVLMAPAYQWMWSRHDVAVHSVQRFTRARLRELAESAGLVVLRLTHRFAVFFPAIAMVRLLTKPGRAGAATPTSDLRALPHWLNRLCYRVARAEQRLCQSISLPFGSTILLVAQKGGP